MSEISVRDNLVKGYSVSCDAREITIHTEYHGNDSHERTEVLFEGVEAYLLAGDNMQSVLFDISEQSIDQILEDFSEEFDAARKHGWPGPWNESTESCRENLTRSACRAWRIESSYGLSGFVMAKDMRLKVASQ